MALVSVATGMSWLGRLLWDLPDVVMFYLFVVMVVAARGERGPSLVAAVVSVAAYDLLFVPPYYTFHVHNISHLSSFVMMFVVAWVVTALAQRRLRSEQAARRREHDTAALYALSRDLGGALDEAGVARVLARHAGELFHVPAAVIVPSSDETRVIHRGDLELGPHETAAVRWVIDHGRAAGVGTDTLPAVAVSCLPVKIGARTIGALALGAGVGRAPEGERHLLEAFVRQGSLALARARLAEDARAAALRARAEELRSSLLSAVSHDLRTPLGVITGAASALRQQSSELGPSERADLLETIGEEAERLERLVRNLLDMVRVGSGNLEVRRDWVPLEEIVGAALTRLEGSLEGRAVTTTMPGDLPLLSVDPVLIQQVIINLLENATKYTPASGPIDIAARQSDAQVCIDVADRGPGVPVGCEDKIFDKFYRGAHAGRSGVGLGLAICRGIVEAHGGTITAHNRAGGGALFRILLPMVGGAPSIELPALAQHRQVGA